MKKTFAGIALSALLATALVPSCAATKTAAHNPPTKTAAAKKVVSAICPVQGNKIPDVTKAAGKSVYKGKTYYFCCAGCKPLFDKNPEKYIHKK